MAQGGRADASRSAVERLQTSLDQLRAELGRAAELARRDLERRMAALEAALEASDREVGRLSDELDCCDEDDYAAVNEQLEAAREERGRLWFRLSEARDASRPFSRRDRELEDLLRRALPAATSRLGVLAEAIAGYESLRVPDGGAGPTRFSVPKRGGVVAGGVGAHKSAPDVYAPGSVDPRHRASLTAVPIPAGFEWVMLDDIRREDDLRPDETFHKGVTEQDMAAGLRKLASSVLPTLKSMKGANSDLFRAFDRGRGWDYANGVQKIFEVFFGAESIVLTRSPDGLGYGVTNGRHRIHLARLEGWAALPAKVIR